MRVFIDWHQEMYIPTLHLARYDHMIEFESVMLHPRIFCLVSSILFHRWNIDVATSFFNLPDWTFATNSLTKLQSLCFWSLSTLIRCQWSSPRLPEPLTDGCNINATFSYNVDWLRCQVGRTLWEQELLVWLESKICFFLPGWSSTKCVCSQPHAKRTFSV